MLADSHTATTLYRYARMYVHDTFPKAEEKETPIPRLVGGLFLFGATWRQELPSHRVGSQVEVSLPNSTLGIS